MKKIHVILLVLISVFCSCDNCSPQLEIRNYTDQNYTVYYDSPSLASFGVGTMDTVSFGVGEKKERTIRIVLWGTDLPVKRETVSIDCKDTYVILIGSP